MAASLSEHVAYSSQSQFSCPNATEHDKCILFCDQDAGKHAYEYTFDCGNAGLCEFHCSGDKCFESGSLNAATSSQLIVTSSAPECLRTATVNVPDSGTASFSMTAEKSFKEMIVNAGTNTQSIAIDCTFGSGDECKELTVNAASAEYLEIIIGADSDLDAGAIINCPQHSAYQGPERAACILDASQGGKLNDITINTVNGIPHDVWIKTGPIALSKVEITCSAGSSVSDGNVFYVQSDCWITDAPTVYHTPSPIPWTATANPTNLPTLATMTDSDIGTDLQLSTSSLLKEAAVDHQATTMYLRSVSLSPNNLNASTSTLLSSEQTIMVVLIGLFLALALCVICICVKLKLSLRDSDEHQEGTRPRLHVQIPTTYSHDSHQSTHLAVPSHSKCLSSLSTIVRMEDEKASDDDLQSNAPRIWNTPTGDTYHEEDCSAFKDELDEINNSDHDQETEMLHVRVTDDGGHALSRIMQDDLVEHCRNDDEDVVQMIDNIGGTLGGDAHFVD